MQVIKAEMLGRTHSIHFWHFLGLMRNLIESNEIEWPFHNPQSIP